MTENELDALTARIQSCWIVPQGATSADEVRTVITIHFNQDGSLQGEPEVTSRPTGRYSEIAPASRPAHGTAVSRSQRATPR